MEAQPPRNNASAVFGALKVVMKDAIANIARNHDFANRQAASHATEIHSESIIDRFSKVLLASDVALRCLDRSVAKQKLNL